jgi:hypothetical protein
MIMELDVMLVGVLTAAIKNSSPLHTVAACLPTHGVWQFCNMFAKFPNRCTQLPRATLL